MNSITTKTLITFFISTILWCSCQKKEPVQDWVCSCTTTSDIKNYTPACSNYNEHGTKSKAISDCAKNNRSEKSKWFFNEYNEPATYVTTCTLH